MKFGRLRDYRIRDALLQDPSLRPMDRDFRTHLRNHPVQSLRGHARILGVSHETIRRASSKLIQTGWAHQRIVEGKSVVVPWMPMEVEKLLVDDLERIRHAVGNFGEWLLHSLLDLLVVDDVFIDNARPLLLVTGEGSGRYELDRWYVSANTAFEFQGYQHFETGGPLRITKKQLQDQKGRDKQKAELCHEEGIKLIAIRGRQLDYAYLRSEIEDFLPLYPIDDGSLIVKAFRRMCRSYRNYLVNRFRTDDMRRDRPSPDPRASKHHDVPDKP